MISSKVENKKQGLYTPLLGADKSITNANKPLLSVKNTQSHNGLSVEHTSKSNQQYVKSYVKVKSKDGKTYNFNKTLENRINNVTAKLQKAEKENGLIGKAWSWTKNTIGFGDSSDKVREIQANERKLLAQFNSNEQNRPKIFLQLTGFKYTEENLEKFIKGQIKLKSEIAIEKYKEGQEMAVDITSDIVSGVVAYGSATLCIAGGIAAAPFTAGASLGAVAVGVGIAAGAGAATKVAIKGCEAAIGGKKYSLKQAGKDATIGAVSGALAPVTAGAGGAVANSVSKVAPKFVATTARLSVEGATFGAADGGVRSALEGDSIGDVAINTLKGAGVGALTGNVLGHCGNAVGKGVQKFVNWIPFGKVPEDVPQVVIPKKTTTNLYPKEDIKSLQLMKENLKTYSSGQQDIELNEITAKAYTKEVEEVLTKGKFCFHKEAEKIPIGEKYTVIKTQNDGSYRIYKSTQSGSNPGFWAEHIGSGDLFYLKTANGQQNITEYVSSQIYRAAGIDTPEMNLIAAPGFNYGIGEVNCWIKSKAITDLKLIYTKPETAYEGFAVDAWLANWDAVCSGNTLIKNGAAVRVDFGGTLNFRARGAKKNFGNEVFELSTLLDSNINPESARVFQNMTREDLIKSLERVQSVTEKDIQDIYETVKLDMSPEIFTTIQNRQKYLCYILNEVKNMPLNKGESISAYVKRVEELVSKKYKQQITRMNVESDKRNRILKDMVEQRNKVCSNEDQLAIWDYKGSSNTANTCIQYGDYDDPLVTSLDSALDKTSLTENIILYRGDHFIIDSHTNIRYASLFPEYDNCAFNHVVNILENCEVYDPNAPITAVKYGENGIEQQSLLDIKTIISRIYKKGRIVEESQFVSTSINLNVAKCFGSKETDIIYIFKAPKGLKATCPEKLNPVKYGKETSAPGHLTGESEGSEAEILLKRGFKYRMDNLIQKDGQYYIECTIL